MASRYFETNGISAFIEAYWRHIAVVRMSAFHTCELCSSFSGAFVALEKAVSTLESTDRTGFHSATRDPCLTPVTTPNALIANISWRKCWIDCASSYKASLESHCATTVDITSLKVSAPEWCTTDVHTPHTTSSQTVVGLLSSSLIRSPSNSLNSDCRTAGPEEWIVNPLPFIASANMVITP